MNAFTYQSKSKTTFPAHHARLQPLVTGAYVILRDVPSQDQADGLVTNESPLFEDKRATRSNLNSTMAVALTARQFASPRGAPRACAAAGPIDAALIGGRQ